MEIKIPASAISEHATCNIGSLFLYVLGETRGGIVQIPSSRITEIQSAVTKVDASHGSYRAVEKYLRYN